MKRAADIALALLLIALLTPFFLVVAAWMVFKRDLPVFYISERMRDLDRPFDLVKFRTMRTPKPGEANVGVSGGDKADRITPLGQFLRKYRLDEVPQLWNIVRGDMSFVGPRPPLRRYTERYPELYAEVLRSKPGITGLASLTIHRQEARVLAEARSPEETEAIYERRIIARKAKLDLIYQRHSGICYDAALLLATFASVLLGSRRTRHRRASK